MATRVKQTKQEDLQQHRDEEGRLVRPYRVGSERPFAPLTAPPQSKRGEQAERVQKLVREIERLRVDLIDEGASDLAAVLKDARQHIIVHGRVSAKLEDDE